MRGSTWYSKHREMPGWATKENNLEAVSKELSYLIIFYKQGQCTYLNLITWEIS